METTMKQHAHKNKNVCFGMYHIHHVMFKINQIKIKKKREGKKEIDNDKYQARKDF